MKAIAIGNLVSPLFSKPKDALNYSNPRLHLPCLAPLASKNLMVLMMYRCDLLYHSGNHLRRILPLPGDAQE
jgi:hypothetical protein